MILKLSKNAKKKKGLCKGSVSIYSIEKEPNLFNMEDSAKMDPSQKMESKDKDFSELNSTSNFKQKNRPMKHEIFKYQETQITFKNENGEVFVNATEMAKQFDKQPVHWLNLQSTSNFVSEYSKLRNRSLADLVTVTRGGSNSGTWMHEDLALEFARWLSPKFAFWCNDRIKELVKNGYTKLDSITRKDLAKMLLEAEEEKEKLIKESWQKTLALKEAAPKVLFADAVTASEASILVGELAKILKQRGIDIGQNRLFIWLRDNGYLCKRGESYNLPTQYAMELGLFEIKKTSISQPDGTVFVTETPKVTPKGQIYFINKFLNAA